MSDYFTKLEARYWKLESMRTELDDLVKVAIMITTLKDQNEFEPLMKSIRIMKEEEASWRLMSALFTEVAKRLNKKSENRPQHSNMIEGQLAQVSRKRYMPHVFQTENNNRCFY